MAPSCKDWRGEWLSLKDLAQVMGKNYGHIRVMLCRGELDNIPGLKIYRFPSRVWVQVSRETMDSLVSCNS